MKPEELRNNLKATLDKAAQGQVITIKRGGLTFELRAVFPGKQALTAREYTKLVAELEEPSSTQEVIEEKIQEFLEQPLPKIITALKNRSSND